MTASASGQALQRRKRERKSLPLDHPRSAGNYPTGGSLLNDNPGSVPSDNQHGGPGTGKTHIATAIGVQAIEHRQKRVRFFSTVDLVNALEQEKIQGRAGQIAGRLAHCDLVILDELGYLPFSASGGALIFHLLSRLYE